MNSDRLGTYGRLALRLLGLAAVVGGVLTIGLLGWQWHSNATVGQVAVTGTSNVVPDTVRRMARVDRGAVMETIDAGLIVDRVTRHPWIEGAEITKQWARRTLMISVTERTPAALVLNEDGGPAYYVDRAGYAMPPPDSGGYDVPLVRGLNAEYHPVQQVAPSSLQTLLKAFPGTDAEPLVAELVFQPDSTFHLITGPIGAHDALTVRLGTGRFPTKLRRLRAFAEQVLRTSPAKNIAEIDLRFRDQIVTREHPLDG